MKTAREIIQETAIAYTIGDRAKVGSACAYINNNGDMCAVGRCAISPDTMEEEMVGLDVLLSEELDELLRPEYRGHSRCLWMDLQWFHDHDAHWNGRRLTDKGHDALKILLDTHCKGDDAQ
jgi:hypothetical protein